MQEFISQKEIDALLSTTISKPSDQIRDVSPYLKGFENENVLKLFYRHKFDNKDFLEIRISYENSVRHITRKVATPRSNIRTELSYSGKDLIERLKLMPYMFDKDYIRITLLNGKFREELELPLIYKKLLNLNPEIQKVINETANDKNNPSNRLALEDLL
ncbi:MAG: hypothetical protein Q8P15_03850 [Nanoarchaeota archaeon]|nr:hypothetical protein [Nanoarchaeota archaeon]